MKAIFLIPCCLIMCWFVFSYILVNARSTCVVCAGSWLASVTKLFGVVFSKVAVSPHIQLKEEISDVKHGFIGKTKSTADLIC